mmetsp:Transcript_17398/g.29225  ORF Transcript_17398/g.29225 Transcript_17398/m.29225 type:complete len:291 (+) Transcript_17398:89-961(+)
MSSSILRSSFLSSLSLRSLSPHSATSASASRLGRCFFTHPLTMPFPRSLSRCSHISRPSPLQSTSSLGRSSLRSIACTAWWDRSSTLGPLYPLCVSSKPVRSASTGLFLRRFPLPASGTSSAFPFGITHRKFTAYSDTPASCSPLGWGPVKGVRAGYVGTRVCPNAFSRRCPVPSVPTRGKDSPPVATIRRSVMWSSRPSSLQLQRPSSVRWIPSTLVLYRMFIPRASSPWTRRSLTSFALLLLGNHLFVSSSNASSIPTCSGDSSHSWQAFSDQVRKRLRSCASVPPVK